MTITPDLGLALIVAFASFVASLAVTLTKVGRQAERIDTVTTETDKVRQKVEALSTSSTEHTAQIHAIRGQQQQAEIRHADAIDKLENTLEGVRSDVADIKVATAEIRAAVKA